MKQIIKLNELFGNYVYKIPKDPELMLYDFYFLTAYGSKIEGRNEDADWVIQEATKDCVNQLNDHMIKAVFFAICAEFRHILDAMQLNNIEDELTPKEYKFIQGWAERFAMAKGIENMPGNKIIALNLNKFTISPRDRKILANESNQTRLMSYTAVRETMKKQGLDIFDFAKITEKIFNNQDRWANSYGGRAWAGISDALFKLYTAKTYKDKVIWIDHAYDLQHNTDTVFNKLNLYYKEGYSWIKRALDWKRDTMTLKSYYDKVSPSLKPIVAYVNKTFTGEGMIKKKPVSNFKIGDYVKFVKPVNYMNFDNLASFEAKELNDYANKINREILLSSEPNEYHNFTVFGITTAGDRIAVLIQDIDMNHNRLWAFPESELKKVPKPKVKSVPKDMTEPIVNRSRSSNFKFKLGQSVYCTQFYNGTDIVVGNYIKSKGLQVGVGNPNPYEEYQVMDRVYYDSNEGNVYIVIKANGDSSQGFVASEKNCTLVKNPVHTSQSDTIEDEVRIRPVISDGQFKYKIGLMVQCKAAVDEKTKVSGQSIVHDYIISKGFFPGKHGTVKLGKQYKILEHLEYPGVGNVFLVQEINEFGNGGLFYIVLESNIVYTKPAKVSKSKSNVVFKEGDFVKIIDDGQIYAGNTKWAEDHSFGIDKNAQPDIKHLFKVIAYGKHQEFSDMLVGISDVESGFTKNYVIGVTGVELTKYVPKKDKKEKYRFSVGDEVYVTDNRQVYPDGNYIAGELGVSGVPDNVYRNTDLKGYVCDVLAIGVMEYGHIVYTVVQPQEMDDPFVIKPEGLAFYKKPKEKKYQFAVGDTVIVKNNGDTYPDGKEIALKLGIKDVINSVYKHVNLTGITGTVLAIGQLAGSNTVHVVVKPTGSLKASFVCDIKALSAFDFKDEENKSKKESKFAIGKKVQVKHGVKALESNYLWSLFHKEGHQISDERLQNAPYYKTQYKVMDIGFYQGKFIYLLKVGFEANHDLLIAMEEGLEY